MVRWGITGPGGIGRAFFAVAQGSASGQVAAIASGAGVSPKLAEAFPGAQIHAGYQSLTDDPQNNVIDVATSCPIHTEWGAQIGLSTC